MAGPYRTHGAMCTSKSTVWNTYQRYEPAETRSSSHSPAATSVTTAPPSPPAQHCSTKPAGLPAPVPVDFRLSRKKKKGDPQNPDTILQCAACKAVLALDYDAARVKEAALFILRKGRKVTSERLLDIIGKLEDNAQDSGSDMLFADDEEEEEEGETCDPSAVDSEEDLYNAPAAGASSARTPSRTCAAEARLDSGFGGAAAQQNPPYTPAAAVVDEALTTLKKENERLKKATTCKICLDADVTTLFLPCRHLVCCQSCSDSVVDCPVCRERILGTVKTYLA